MRHPHMGQVALCRGVGTTITGARAVRAWLLAALAAVCSSTSPAQAELGFTEVVLTDSTLNSSPNSDFWIASAAPADVDVDGDLDLLVAGYYVIYPFSTVEERLTLYRNDGAVDEHTWALTPMAVDPGNLSFASGDIAWGDYDNDGDPDAVVAGAGEMALYRNDAGALVRTSTSLPAYAEVSDFTTFDLHSLSWVDYDNDSDLDLFVPSGVTELSEVTILLRNDGPGPGDTWSFTDVGADLPTAQNAVSVWADDDGDGDLDLLLANVSPWGDNFLGTFHNDAGTFTAAATGLAYIRYGTTDWGDAEGDGDLDIVYAGNMDLPDESGETAVRILYRESSGDFSPVDIIDMKLAPSFWLHFTAVTWADYDSDGDVDLLVSGNWLGDNEIVGRSVVYANDGHGTFTLASVPLPAPIAGNAGGTFAWFDVDGDGDLDYFVAGGYYVVDGNGLIEARTQLFRNDAQGANASPTVPSALRVTPGSDDEVRLAWDPASDDGTSQAALTYEIEVSASGVLPVNKRGLPESGNVSRNTTWALHGLAPGTYAWSVRAVDNAFNASSMAQGTFSVPGGTAVMLADFAAEALDSGVLLTWRVEADEPIRGFRVYRRESDGDPWFPLTGDPIAAEARRYLDAGVQAGRTYHYALTAVSADGSEVWSREFSVSAWAPRSVLLQHYPNPFNPLATIQYKLPAEMQVDLGVFDVHGKRVATLDAGIRQAGINKVVWQGRDAHDQPVASGVYFYRLAAGSWVILEKTVMLK